jgi:hypothetical protein
MKTKGLNLFCKGDVTSAMKNQQMITYMDDVVPSIVERKIQQNFQ